MVNWASGIKNNDIPDEVPESHPTVRQDNKKLGKFLEKWVRETETGG